MTTSEKRYNTFIMHTVCFLTVLSLEAFFEMSYDEISVGTSALADCLEFYENKVIEILPAATEFFSLTSRCRVASFPDNVLFDSAIKVNIRNDKVSIFPPCLC